MRLLETARRYTVLELAARVEDTDLAVAAFELNEPYPLWSEFALKHRADVYSQAAHPLAAKARDDFETFVAHAPRKFTDILAEFKGR